MRGPLFPSPHPHPSLMECIGQPWVVCQQRPPSMSAKSSQCNIANPGFSQTLQTNTPTHTNTENTQEIASNAKLSENYLALARDLDVMEAKTPEDIYKSHLVEGRAPSGAAQDSARQNLATTFVNAFVNAGYGHDKLLTAVSEADANQVSWIFKNKEHGKMSATASLGAVLLWDVDGGLPQVRACWAVMCASLMSPSWWKVNGQTLSRAFPLLDTGQVGGMSTFHSRTHYPRTSHQSVVELASTSPQTRARAAAVC